MASLLQDPSIEAVAAEAPVNVRAVREALGLTQAEFAHMTRISLKSITNWENGHPISGAFERVLREIEALQQALSRNLAPETIGNWLRKPNPYFGGKSPAQLVEHGQTERLWRFIYRLEAGEPG